jgi:hypothetical protein
MLRYAKTLGMAVGLLLSLTAQATTYSFIGGATFDVYYDTTVLGSNLSLSGNNLKLSFTEGSDSFYLDTNSYDSPLVIVPHAGYELAHDVIGQASATAIIGGPGGWNVSGTTALYGGTFVGGAFTYQSFVAETDAFGHHDTFLGDEPQTVHLNALEINTYDMDPGASYAAYAVNFQGGASAGWTDASTVLHTPEVNFSFTLAGNGTAVAPVPETSTWLMLAAGLALLAARAKRSAA